MPMQTINDTANNAKDYWNNKDSIINNMSAGRGAQESAPTVAAPVDFANQQRNQSSQINARAPETIDYDRLGFNSNIYKTMERNKLLNRVPAIDQRGYVDQYYSVPQQQRDGYHMPQQWVPNDLDQMGPQPDPRMLAYLGTRGY